MPSLTLKPRQNAPVVSLLNTMQPSSVDQISINSRGSCSHHHSFSFSTSLSFLGCITRFIHAVEGGYFSHATRSSRVGSMNAPCCHSTHALAVLIQQPSTKSSSKTTPEAHQTAEPMKHLPRASKQIDLSGRKRTVGNLACAYTTSFNARLSKACIRVRTD